MNNGVNLNRFREYDYSHHPCFNNVKEEELGRYRIAHLDKKVPMVYKISAVKK